MDFILLQNFASNKLYSLVKFVVNPISVGKFLLETNTFKYRYIFRRIQPFWKFRSGTIVLPDI